MYGQCITPVSKCCCSGTPYANAEQHGIIMPDNVTTTVDKHGVLHAFPASNAYSRLENVRPYLYEAWYDKLDYDAAYAWFSTKQPPVAAGACSSFRIGNTFARNFDWLYDRGAEFVVHTRCKDGRFATTGVASALPGMFDEVARDRMRTALFSYLPFTIVDGFNEAGVYISTNIVPNERGNNNYRTPTGESLTTICTAMLPRFILDSFDSALSAVYWLDEHATMFPSKTLLAKGYHQHFLLADAEYTLALEFIDGEFIVVDAPGDTVKGITNFHVVDVTFNADGTVYTPADVPTHTPTTENGLTPHGMGLERWNIMAGFTGTDARDLLDALRYTKAYPTATASAIPAWLTEFVDGNRTVDSPASDFAHALQVAGELYANRKRDGQTWHTVHSSVYDMENQLLHLQVQEDTTTTYSFGLDGKCCECPEPAPVTGGRFLGFIDYTYDPNFRIGTLTGPANAGDYYVVRKSGAGYGSSVSGYFLNGVNAQYFLYHTYDTGGHSAYVSLIKDEDHPTAEMGDVWMCLEDNTPSATPDNLGDIWDRWILLRRTFNRPADEL